MSTAELGKAFSEHAESKRLADVLAWSVQQIKLHAMADLRRAAEGCTAEALQAIEAEDRAIKAATAFAEHALRFAWERRP